ncbi:ASCH domain-containing protein [Streptomyces sp. t39]|uniref:ASCH domain-containing protein n=1 Tax=Streptomyces sp. t39 TaxID=1828156 RepID=UPI0011CD8C64|nr:ASCH domain-containing protein [Streptomyces sp. t39]TXS49177.1 ASCH domain-containing protein [Streptomyces sp. t39]
MWPRIGGLRTLDLGVPGELRDRLNALVLSGAKRATAGLLEADYRAEGEEPESVGERLVLVGSEGERVAEVEVESVEVVAFGDVSWDFAQAEGEGSRSLGHWREVHIAYWRSAGHAVTDGTDIVCVRFRLVPPAG